MSNSSPWIQDSKGRLYKHVTNKYGETVRQYEDDVREVSSSSRQRPQSRQTHKSDYRGSQNASGHIVDAESKGQPSWDRKERVPEATSRRGESSSRYGSGQSQAASISAYKDPSYDKRGVYNEPQEPPYQTPESSSYTWKTVSNDYSSADDYNDPQTRDWTRSSTAGDPLISTMGALSIAPEDSRAPVSSFVPTRGDASYIPNGISTMIPEDSRSPSQWTSSSAMNEQSMHSNPYQGKGKRPAGNSQKPKGRFISGTLGHAEELDPSYKIRSFDYKNFFRLGRVFSTLWTDAFAATTNDSEQDASTSVTYIIHGERVHSKIRRFVVVRQAKDLRSCTCVSITTYKNQGVNKRGISLHEHGLIYSFGKAPRSPKGIDKEPLKVYLSKDGDQLISPSLVNYGRIYTLECNVKVKDVGELDSSSRRLLRQYFKEVIIGTDEFDGEPSQLPSQAANNTLAGVGGVGAMAPPMYESRRATDFASSGNNRSSSGAQYGYSGYIQDQNLASQSHDGNPTALAAQGLHNSAANYGADQSLDVRYDPATVPSTYTRNDHAVFDSSSATANPVPHVNYTTQNVSSIPRSYPPDSSSHVGSYNDNPIYRAHGSVAPVSSVAGGAGYPSDYATPDNRGEDDIVLDDSYDSRKGRASSSSSSRTVRPSGGRKHRHHS